MAKIMTKEISKKLSRQFGDDDPVPHLKIFNPCGSATWKPIKPINWNGAKQATLWDQNEQTSLFGRH